MKTKASKVKPIKPFKAYAGVVDNKIGGGWKDWVGNIVDVRDIFRTRSEARQHFELVIPVLITPLKKK